MIGGLGGAGRSAGSPAGNPAAAGGLSGLLPGASGSSADNPPNPPNPTDPNIHGTTGAWINGYDLGARAAIAAAPSKSVADSLITQLSADRAQGARNIIGFEARNNVQQRQDTAVTSVQTIAARGVAADPATLPQALAFLERHPVRVDGGPQGQASFDAGLRHTLVDAGMQSLIARDPAGVLRALGGGITNAAPTDGMQDNAEGDGDTSNPVPLHPAIAALTPQERSAYFPQAQAAFNLAQGREQVETLQSVTAATQAYRTTGTASNPPALDRLTRVLGPEEGARQFQQMADAQAEGQQTRLFRSYPSADLEQLRDAPPGAQGATQGATQAEITRRAALTVLGARQADPMQAGIDAGAYGLTPVDLSSPQAALASITSRVTASGTLARSYGTTRTLLSDQEFADTAKLLQGMPPDQVGNWLKQLGSGIGDTDLARSTALRLSADDPVIGLAALQLQDEAAAPPQPKGDPTLGGAGVISAPQTLLDGYALLHPVDGKTPPFAMPPEQQTRAAFADQVGERFADQPGAQEAHFQGALAAYAALSKRAGDDSGRLDAQRWQAAVSLSVEGSGTVGAVGLGPFSGTDDERAQRIRNTYADASGSMGPIGTMLDAGGAPSDGSTYAFNEVGLDQLPSAASTQNRLASEQGKSEEEVSGKPTTSTSGSQNPTDTFDLSTTQNPYGLTSDQLNKAEAYLRDFVGHGGVKPEELTPHMRQHIETRTQEILQRAEELKNVPSVSAWDPDRKTARPPDTLWQRAIDSIDAARPPKLSTQSIALQQSSSVPLKLGSNQRYQPFIDSATKLTGVPGPTIAAIISAEADHLSNNKPFLERELIDRFFGPGAKPTADELAEKSKTPDWIAASKELQDVWNPAASGSGSAHGLSQVVKKTWLGEAETPGRFLNEKAKKLGFVDAKNNVTDPSGVLNLRNDPETAIIAGAQYDKSEFDKLAKKTNSNGTPLIPQNLTDDEQAYYLYIVHHEGPGRAEAFLKGTYPEDTAKDNLHANLRNPKVEDRLIKESGGSASKAYSKWLDGYTRSRIIPFDFRGDAKK